VTHTVKHYEEAARRKNLRFEFELPSDPLHVLADRSALAQVLDNLLSNAIKFSAYDKQINITVRPIVTGAECLIRDQGPGFQCRGQNPHVSALWSPFRPPDRGRTFHRPWSEHR
jgi:signal transduction histidine kinase